MASKHGAATACKVDSAALARRVNECVTPRPAARRSRSNELVEIGANGLVDLRLASVTRRLTEYALEYCGGNLEWAADEIGVNVSTVRRWLHEWALEDAAATALAIVPSVREGGRW